MTTREIDKTRPHTIIWPEPPVRGELDYLPWVDAGKPPPGSLAWRDWLRKLGRGDECKPKIVVYHD
jgi:hypothetical protein